MQAEEEQEEERTQAVAAAATALLTPLLCKDDPFLKVPRLSQDTCTVWRRWQVLAKAAFCVLLEWVS